jgi:hypothetical protein
MEGVMPSSLADSLHLANENFRARLPLLQSAMFARPAALNLRAISADLVASAQTLQACTPAMASDSALKTELLEFRNHLEQLCRILPSLRVRFEVEKGRLRTALERLQTVKAWANANDF